MIAEELIKAIRALAPEDRVPVIRSILRSAGPGMEELVLKHERRYKAQGLDPTEALISALEVVITAPWGGNILRVIASAAAIGARDKGIVARENLHEAAREYARVLTESAGQPDNLGFVAELIAAGAAIISIATSAITAAVHKVRQRRRKLKRRLTAVSRQEAEEIIAIVVRRHPTYASAEDEILENIAQIREGRRAYLLDPATGTNAGSKVNERRMFVEIWQPARAAIVAQIQAEQRKKSLLLGGAATVASVFLVGGVVIITRNRRQKSGE
jgi:hypothetical protein